MYFAREEGPKLSRMLGWKESLALIGPRRIGKTSIALQLLEEWKTSGGQGEYIDLESLNAPKAAGELMAKAEGVQKGGLLVLDEVQELEGWVKVVREIIERKEWHAIITGSSASLLSKEIASSLGGRVVPEAILPLSYRDARNWGLQSLEEYLRVGGYPECVLRPNDASKLHKLYFELTILRDVAARKRIREIKPLSDLATILLSEAGKTISSKKTAGMLGISQPTFRSYADALNDAFLILSVPPFIRSPREKAVADAKHYAYDTGLQASVSVSAEKDSGRRFENAVAVELVRRGYSLSYLKYDAGECDFIAQKAGSRPLAVQAFSGDGAMPEREWQGLERGMKAAGADGLLITASAGEKREGFAVKTLEEWLAESVPQ